MKMFNTKDYVREQNKLDESGLYIESRLNYQRNVEKPDWQDLKIEAETAQFKLESLIRYLITGI